MRATTSQVLRTLLLCRIAFATTCYNHRGEIDSGSQVCNPDAAVSHCCHASDFCVSNGLCFNAGANNFLGVQGCTDQNWAAPCLKICQGSSATFGPNVFPCAPSEDSQLWCCGPNATDCCSSGAGFSISVGTVFLRAEQTASASASAASSTPGVDASATSTSAGTSSTATSTSSTTASSSGNSSSSSKSLAIGLGVGIPLGVLFTCALGFLAWELRRYNNQRLNPGQPGVGMAKQEPEMMPVEAGSGHYQEGFDGGSQFHGEQRGPGELDAANQIHELRHR